MQKNIKRWSKILPIKKIQEILLPDYNGFLIMELRSRYFDNIQESMENLTTIETNILKF